MSLNKGTVCDDRVIRCDMDGGFREGRQFGRGESMLINADLRYQDCRIFDTFYVAKSDKCEAVCEAS